MNWREKDVEVEREKEGKWREREGGSGESLPIGREREEMEGGIKEKRRISLSFPPISSLCLHFLGTPFPRSTNLCYPVGYTVCWKVFSEFSFRDRKCCLRVIHTTYCDIARFKLSFQQSSPPFTWKIGTCFFLLKMTSAIDEALGCYNRASLTCIRS